ncbi:DUF167 domain-containing protein [Deltaproteobacteria bacterium OttesenSCG-928-K17]|nr:DUF167 domain-containing protein [Deltaproteobacteria bacterium OttesenSCG-928-K17]
MAEDVACLKVLLSPRAKATALVGLQGEDLKIKVAAPPVEGAANQALLKFLAGLLGHSANLMEVTAGQRGRRKIVKIKGLSEAELQSRLAPHLADNT